MDVTYSDVLSNRKFGLTGHEKASWVIGVIMADGMYCQSEKNQEHPGGLIRRKRQFKATLSLAELAVPNRLTWNPVVADVLVGGRFNYFYQEIGIPTIPLKVDSTKQWVDPFVGGRILIPLAKSWFLGLRGTSAGSGSETARIWP